MLSSNYQDITSPLYPESYPPQFYYNSPALTSPSKSPPVLNYFYPRHRMDTSLISLMSSSPNSSAMSPIQQINNLSLIRFDVSLDAPTAAAQKLDEPPLTYLNKGQFYNISLKDKDQFDGEIKSTISITFHDENHRQSASDYWKYWLSQQKQIDDARAVEIDVSRCSGAQVIEGRHFDRISFKWHSKQGASVNVRFNCLSTDFSRIKGVKGIPLRLQIESHQVAPLQTPIEKTYCRIKLFRDKGAERKNKDDAKHIERQLEKLRGKNGETHPLWLAYSPTNPITLFSEVVSPSEEDNQYQLNQILTQDNDPYHSNIQLPPPMKRSFSHLHNEADLTGTHIPVELDPAYVPQRRKRVAKLSILVKFYDSDVYRAVYLEHLTVQELIDKISQRMDIQKPIANVFRRMLTKDTKPVIIKVDDEVIQDMPEEQDILIDTEENPKNHDTVNLILIF